MDRIRISTTAILTFLTFSALTSAIAAEERSPDLDVSAIYAAVAPATVVVRTPHGHGTGFIVDPEGWVLTNHHVVAEAPIDPRTCTRTATIFFGCIGDDGFMQLTDEEATAEVFVVDELRDLALLRLNRTPGSAHPLPCIRPAAKVPGPGSPCVVIGHPAAGMLWTVRSGLLAGSGVWPSDRIDEVMERRASRQDRVNDSHSTAGSEHRRRVIISSCGLNPGDSGSALVDAHGEIIGISFAIPGGTDAGGIHLDKFSYHVHLDEVLAFLGARPQMPQVCAPSARPDGTEAGSIDLDGNGIADARGFTDASGRLVGLALDLDHNTHIRKSALLGSRSEEPNYEFEFAIHYFPVRRAFYDTDNDGEIDFIAGDLDEDGIAEQCFQRTEAGWVPAPETREPLIAPQRFADAALADRLTELASWVTSPPTAGKREANKY
jgi:hypothetical protein